MSVSFIYLGKDVAMETWRNFIFNQSAITSLIVCVTTNTLSILGGVRQRTALASILTVTTKNHYVKVLTHTGHMKA